MNRPVAPHAWLFFDHLHGEYLALKPSIKDYGALNHLEGIAEKRVQQQLTWSDIYTFDLLLVELRPAESLIRKAYDARARYRSVAGQREYDAYLASRPVDLGAVDMDNAAISQQIERDLRADIRYLLGQFYLYSALLPLREGLRDELTRKAVLITAIVCTVIAIALALNLGVPALDRYSAVVITVLTVILAGIVGGCVSMLQRIQSAPSDGDALFNLAALNSGWRGIMLSPLYGGIFAFLLFVLFAGKVLDGAVFPTIVTSSKPPTTATSSAPPATRPPITASSSPSTSTTTQAPDAAQSQASSSPAAEVSTTVQPAASSTGPRTGVLHIKDFLKDTGPSSGIAYALLILWSFLAGFAERLVPDTLNRLVKKNIDQGGG
ncbi:MAG TPA: hypothetical protein VFX97_06535 [Pyrinomonadaceae bacterium]|nr:hypothetical protein [Pyrinomonadaceae bacterium]